MRRWLRRFDSFQQRHRVLAVPVAVNKRFGEHNGTRLAATVSYYSFFSVFPLLLVFVTVLGIVLDDNPELRQELYDGALGQIPLLGSQLTQDQAPLEGSIVALVVGLATAAWAGMGAVGALQLGLDELSDVPVHARPTFAIKRLKGLGFLVAFAITVVASTMLANLATLFDLGPFTSALGVVATLGLQVALLVAMLTVLPARPQPLRRRLPGALIGGVAMVALALLGSFVVRRFIAGATDTYGTFAVVIALLSWFHLVSRILLLAAELNEVLANQLSPRSLSGDVEATEADRRAILLDVQRIQRDPRMGYAVAVGPDVAGDADLSATGAAPEAPPGEPAAVGGER